MTRLNKYIAMSGICSRRKADELIESGKVKINNVIAKTGDIVNDNDIVIVNNKKINFESKIYLVLNKPSGYVTTNSDERNRRCVIDLIHENERVFPVGRLDRDTEGLLLLTNDGDFSNKLMHPSNNVNKVYIATVLGDITEDKIDKLRNGVIIDDKITDKAIIKQIDIDKLEITIHEGRNRQVRKMCESVNLNVVKLKRVKVANLVIGKLKRGEYRKLTKNEVNDILKYISNNKNV